MTGFFLLFDDDVQSAMPCKELRISLDKNGFLRNDRTKYDRTDLTLYKGDTETFIFKAHSNQKPASLQGYTIRAQARKTPDSPETLFDIIINDGEHMSSFVEGIFTMRLSSTITNNLPSLCRYDIQASTDSDVMTLVTGSIRLHLDVVKP